MVRPTIYWAVLFLVIDSLILSSACSSNNTSTSDGGPIDAGTSDGGIVDAGTCGGDGQRCCYVGLQPCYDGLGCRSDSTCAVCGQRNQPCCYPDLTCLPALDGRVECQLDIPFHDGYVYCTACGSQGQPCCDRLPHCDAGLTCAEIPPDSPARCF